MMEQRRKGPNARLEAFLAEHVVTTDGVCSCGWNIANYDIEPYDFGFSKETVAEAQQRAWVAHVKRVFMVAHPLSQIQQVAAIGPSGDEIVFDMEPGHDTLSEMPKGLGRRYYGEYRYADYEPPEPPSDSVPSRRLTCEEAGCRDPHCWGGHFSFSLSIPTESCAGCGKPFAEGDERVAVVMRMPGGTEIKEGTAFASSASYHVGCQPSDEELETEFDELWPRAEGAEGE